LLCRLGPNLAAEVQRSDLEPAAFSDDATPGADLAR
jgi:hypothetical protein